jgi:hypothetical protein
MSEAIVTAEDVELSAGQSKRIWDGVKKKLVEAPVPVAPTGRVVHTMPDFLAETRQAMRDLRSGFENDQARDWWIGMRFLEVMRAKLCRTWKDTGPFVQPPCGPVERREKIAEHRVVSFKFSDGSVWTGCACDGCPFGSGDSRYGLQQATPSGGMVVGKKHSGKDVVVEQPDEPEVEDGEQDWISPLVLSKIATC